MRRVNRLKFKVSQPYSIGSKVYVDTKPRKWYVAWIYVKAFTKASYGWVKTFFKTLFDKQC